MSSQADLSLRTAQDERGADNSGGADVSSQPVSRSPDFSITPHDPRIPTPFTRATRLYEQTDKLLREGYLELGK